MEKKMALRLNLLTGYAIVSSVIFLFLLFSSFAPKGNNENYDELTVKRINLIAEDGSLRMVISNEQRQHPANSSGVFLNGPDGKPRLKLYVDGTGIPKIEIVDEKGGIKNIIEK